MEAEELLCEKKNCWNGSL